ncbi:ribonuclease H-like protein [Hypoxylon rubiginosum]|uniref:Ribonuclease H-like protein n=1 Tax=Hypoxylon rubiginosum TaxID=110542 RepID=A0ACC0DFM4_9PEZI|nr:ribonuclease H-like protein [Hypoxylon rubiginosum]
MDQVVKSEHPIVCGKSGGIVLVAETRQTPRYRRRLTQRAHVRPATIFVPQNPHETPEHHFPLQTITARSTQSRLINRYDSREILILVDGSCINNGNRTELGISPSGGCSFTYKGAGRHGPGTAHPFRDGVYNDDGGTVGFPLEKSGPGGEACDATSNRAKLRAVIAALEFRAWQEEGWRRIVIATDLEYIAFGATRWLPKWVRRRWRLAHKAGRVANRDLWEELNGVIESLQGRGTSVAFWLLPPGGVAKSHSALVRDTKDAAREAAQLPPDAAADEFTRLCGIMV